MQCRVVRTLLYGSEITKENTTAGMMISRWLKLVLRAKTFESLLSKGVTKTS